MNGGANGAKLVVSSLGPWFDAGARSTHRHLVATPGATTLTGALRSRPPRAVCLTHAFASINYANLLRAKDQPGAEVGDFNAAHHVFLNLCTLETFLNLGQTLMLLIWKQCNSSGVPIKCLSRPLCESINGRTKLLGTVTKRIPPSDMHSILQSPTTYN